MIPLHGSAAPDRAAPPEMSEAWDPERIVSGAPAELRPLIVDLLGAVGADEECLDDLRRHLPPLAPGDRSPRDLGAAVSIVRAAIERAADEGEAGEHARVRHARLDAASVAWAEDALDRRAREQRRLLRDVSHDIRSPLNSILFLADALRSGHSGELTDVQSRQVDVMFMAAVTLVKLVNDLIDYAHLDDRAEVRVEDSAFSPDGVVDEVRGLLGPLLEYHAVDLEFQSACEGPRRGDARLLSRVLLNLVSNAIQAMPDGGRVTVEFADGPDGQFEIRVEDDGPGVDFEQLETALARAVEGASLAETDGWTHGLGLSISARLVDAAGGRLDVEPNEPRGTRFVTRLPFPVL